MDGMGVAAVGAYVRTLADLQRITYAEVAEAAGVQAKYIWRLENEAIKEPSARVLRLLNMAVRGSWDDIGELITKADATEVDGRARALAWAARAGLITPGERAVFEQAKPEELDQAAEMLRQRAASLRGK
jgi:transcriptional regulator with XRE-family HTH domain